ncbi:DUF397 domain-containing protein [Streptomyces spectabilis]|uniref:DUF397 domain-containing protein n=1 Tax=Streptomyces spectabilis TaxID=68270 RepID=A0A5P2X800_STRST|nr:DUF397 domain-containing protein [Streptomyces spectabilis]MBB5106790.1 hypothetical protein [Streptomyces spectabilis]MCI3903359.1 DUF397 domain-containing protein [Streptomyces spectabilis]QEV60578.1 DUF397 domain-containing protein [Streptomyces spectabilis]GGV43843.1 toxin [Streptomyces spectabilis]
MTSTPATGTFALKWRKSSYSSNDGPECVEVAQDWRKSSHSGSDDADCVEVAIASPGPGPTVHIRDSKNKNGAQVAVEGAAWAPFVGFAAGTQTV